MASPSAIAPPLSTLPPLSETPRSPTRLPSSREKTREPVTGRVGVPASPPPHTGSRLRSGMTRWGFLPLSAPLIPNPSPTRGEGGSLDRRRGWFWCVAEDGRRSPKRPFSPGGRRCPKGADEGGPFGGPPPSLSLLPLSETPRSPIRLPSSRAKTRDPVTGRVGVPPSPPPHIGSRLKAGMTRWGFLPLSAPLAPGPSPSRGEGGSHSCARASCRTAAPSALLPLREKVGFRAAKSRMRGAPRLPGHRRFTSNLSTPLIPNPSPTRGEGGSHGRCRGWFWCVAEDGRRSPTRLPSSRAKTRDPVTGRVGVPASPPPPTVIPAPVQDVTLGISPPQPPTPPKNPIAWQMHP